jgi:L-aminopeptidase/D-esterase-like protein
MVQRVNAVLLTGGSAFGLGAADGVVQWLREQGQGFKTASIAVPIVSAAVLFDLKGDSPVWPDSDAGYVAASSANEQGWVSGQIGAGTGATVAKLLDRPGTRAGIGVAKVSTTSGSVAALVAVNAVGEVAVARDGHPLQPLGSRSSLEERILRGELAEARPGENTTIGVIVVEGPASRDDLLRLGVAAHDGLARAIHPAHTLFDGDTFFVLTRSGGRLSPQASVQLSVATQRAVMQAVARSLPHGERHRSQGE